MRFASARTSTRRVDSIVSPDALRVSVQYHTLVHAWNESSPFGLCACFFACYFLQELLKDSIQVLRQKCEVLMAEVDAFTSGVDFDEAMP